ncbi:MAG: Gfo/Idh/MocA family oxidoreductase [Clostridia bacterium]|nr:Gfo/Idh/MocA family oxidoreductase [Clostridia bacterium]
MSKNTRKLKVGVIGCGRISVMHLVSVASLEETELVACCDIRLDRAEAAAREYGGRAYASYEEMFDKEELDAVHLCLPHYLHSKVAIYAFERGVNVLTEKPMDIDMESALLAVKRAKECGVQFGVIFQCRYNRSSLLVKDAVTSGRLGKVISARSTLTWSRPRDYYCESDWKGTWDKEGGGVIIDQAIHSLDLVRWVVDSEIESISCTLSNRGHDCIEVEDTAEGLVTFKNGVRYGFYCMNNYGCDEPIEIRLYCEKGRVVFDYDHAYITYNDGTTEEAHPDKIHLSYGGGKDYWGLHHVRQIKQFYSALLGKEPLEITGEEALKTHEMVMNIYNIGRKGLEKD